MSPSLFEMLSGVSLLETFQTNVAEVDFHRFSGVELEADSSFTDTLFVIIGQVDGDFTIYLMDDVIAFADNLIGQPLGDV